MVDGIPTLDDLGDVAGKRVLVRTDFNVPMDGGAITDDFRIRAALPTIDWLTERGATVVAASHLGRPKGQPDPKYSMDAGARPARRAGARRRAAREPAVRSGRGGQRPGVRRTARSTASTRTSTTRSARRHRAHASIVGPPATLPSAMGLLLQKEVEVLLGLRNNPKHPFVAVLGGVEDLRQARRRRGAARRRRLARHRRRDVLHVLRRAGQPDRRLAVRARPGRHVPAAAADLGRRPARRSTCPTTSSGVDADGNFATFGTRLPDGAKGFDIGPGSAAAFSDIIMEARTVFWNGPMGMFEDDRFAAGTRTVAQAMADTKAFTVVGGGDSAAALAQFRLDDEVDHVSTGGGASLELLELGDLPGLEALRKAPNAHG